MPKTLTKSAYLSGLQCAKKLWKEVHNTTEVPKPSFSTQQRFMEGQEVEKIARSRYSNGVYVGGEDRKLLIEQTKQLIADRAPIIFQGAFEHDDVYVRTDILRRNDNGTYDLIEVKSGSSVKDEYVDDLAIQYWVLKGAGVPIKRAIVQHVNSDCVYPDLDDLLIEEDITDTILSIQSQVRENVEDLKEMLIGTEPDVKIGKHCEEPYECPFKDNCWQIVPEGSIFEITGLRWDRKTDLIESGVLAVSELPASTRLSDKQAEIAERVKAGIPVIDQKSIAVELSALKYPLFFFDFETVNPAVPRFDGCRPYIAFPFQYSLHTLHEDGSLTHSEYLHTERSDPRRILAEQMLEGLSTEGSIIAYSATFEMTQIKNLAKQFPDLATALLKLLPRFFDQLIIFRDHYWHPQFKGSNSIKRVLPVLVPSLSYETLQHVHDGTEAGAVWNRAIVESDESVRNAYFQALRNYCRLDTLAMVEIHKHLTNLNQR